MVQQSSTHNTKVVHCILYLPGYSFEVDSTEQYGQHYSVVMKHTSSDTVVHKLHVNEHKHTQRLILSN